MMTADGHFPYLYDYNSPSAGTCLWWWLGREPGAREPVPEHRHPEAAEHPEHPEHAEHAEHAPA